MSVVQIATMFLSWLLFLQKLAKRLHIFNGPWLQHDPTENKLPANISVWRRVDEKLKPQGPTRADLRGMLDTARQTCWEKIRATTPSADKPQDIELLRRANAWHSYENPPTHDTDNPEIRATTSPRTPKNPPIAKQCPLKRQHNQQPTLHEPTNKPSTNQPPKTYEHKQQAQTLKNHARTLIEQKRYDRSNRLLATFKRTNRPQTITSHLQTITEEEELAQIKIELRKHQPDSIEYQSLTDDCARLNKMIIADSILKEKAQTHNLSMEIANNMQSMQPIEN